ncbi:MAG: hypothetical protein PHH40_04460 [Candidatus Moranbacteria bacterium]|nr:hypothetical protein [Candidatus Moranbacteria bacterium]MDD3964511.1 hypothetical protein [Candidatus Moranbacteria bacterium]
MHNTLSTGQGEFVFFLVCNLIIISAVFVFGYNVWKLVTMTF